MSRRSEHGVVLASLVFGFAIVLVLAATSFIAAFLDTQTTANAAAGLEALHVADAGVQHLWAVLEPAPDFTREIGWAGGVPPFGSLVWFPAPPRTYRVRVTERPGGSLRATSEGTSARGSRRRVEAIFHREPVFRPPALLVLSSSADPTSVDGALRLSTTDRDGADPARLALAAENRHAADAFEAAHGDSVAVIGRSGFSDALSVLRTGSDRRVFGVQMAGRWGSAESPEVTDADTVDVTGHVTAFGIVVASGPLRVRGRLQIDGLLLAASGLDVTGELAVRGAVWVAGELRLSGRVEVEQATAALDRADRLRPRTLPRAAILGAWRTVW